MCGTYTASTRRPWGKWRYPNKAVTKSHYKSPRPLWYDIISEIEYEQPHGSDPVGLFLCPKEVCCMGYRKVGYLEQIWYILRYKFRELQRKEDHNAK